MVERSGKMEEMKRRNDEAANERMEDDVDEEMQGLAEGMEKSVKSERVKRKWWRGTPRWRK